jgi:SAM-dependent methyltransferase
VAVDDAQADEAARTLESWSRAAHAYVTSRRDGPLALSAIYEPAIDELLGDVSGRRVLDAGCGDGYDARRLAGRGAIVTAIDGSAEMLALARRHPRQDRIEYRVADLTAVLPLADAAFDAALANMVLMDLPRVDVALRELARVLAANGRLVVALTHPCFFTSDWVHDPHGARLHKAVDAYLTPRVEELRFWGSTPHFHRPLSHYFDALQRSGLVVDALKEAVPSDAQLEQRPDWEHHRRIPSFIVLRAIRR